MVRPGLALARVACETAAMKHQEIATLVKRHEAEIRARGVIRLEVFGSSARGDTHDESDVDVVIDIEPGRKFSLIDHASLRVMLCDIFQRETDVVVRDALRPAFRDHIARESVRVL